MLRIAWYPWVPMHIPKYPRSSCSLPEQMETILWTPVFKVDEVSESRLQPRVGIQHLMHVSRIASHDDDHT